MSNNIRAKIAATMEEVEEHLRAYPHVLSFNIDSTKWSDGKDTGEPCITVFVDEKVPLFDDDGNRLLAVEDTLPKEINGIKIDIISLENPSFSVGKTGIGEKSPKIQKQVAGGLRRE